LLREAHADPWVAGECLTSFLRQARRSDEEEVGEAEEIRASVGGAMVAETMILIRNAVKAK
jgi:hypothetical protein